jgi:hypothetical protein
MEKNKNSQIIHFCLLIFTILLLSCSKDEDINNPENNNPADQVTTVMSVSKNNITFDYLENTNSFLIKNLGNTSFDWNWAETNPSTFISASPNSGTLQPGASIEVTLTLDRSNMITQIYNLTTKVNNNMGQSYSQIIQINNYTEDKWFIEGNVLDAEYDRVNDVLIIVSENPNQIRRFNITNNTEESLSLNNIPKCVSIGQGGNHAVVGHNGSFSYVNLNSMTLENNYPVSTDIFDIVLAPNNWVYITSNVSNQKLRSVNLSNGQETLSQTNSAPNYPNHVKAKLHPSGNYIYTTNEVIPSDIYKYDITNGTAQYLYDSYYHGNYDFGKNFWFSENGNKIFANSKNVFSSSVIQNNDLVYLSSFEELVGDDNKVIDIMDINSVSNRICALFTYNPDYYAFVRSNKIRIFNTQLLNLSEIEIPKHRTINSNGEVSFRSSYGYFGFFNSNGTKFFVLVKYIDTNQSQWAIATINIS